MSIETPAESATTGTQPTPEIPTEAAPTEAPSSFREASQQWIGKMSPEEQAKPLEVEESATEDIDPNAVSWEGWTKDAQGKWHKPDGTFAAAGEAPPETVEATTGSEGPESPEEIPATDPALRVELRGRNGETVPIEVTDPAVAELLRANANDGLRRDEFNRRMAEVTTKEAELKAFESSLAEDPVNVLLDHVRPEIGVQVARALVLQHFEALAPEIEKWWGDVNERRISQMETERALEKHKAQFTKEQLREQRVAEIRSAISAVIPESVDEQTATDFFKDAERDLADAVRAGRAITAKDVPELIARRVRQYGFTPSAPSAAAISPAAPTTSAPVAAKPAPVVARPVGDKAAELADKARASTERMKAAQKARSLAAAVTPPGAGALPTTSKVPKAFDSIADASKAIRSTGKSWQRSA